MSKRKKKEALEEPIVEAVEESPLEEAAVAESAEPISESPADDFAEDPVPVLGGATEDELIEESPEEIEAIESAPEVSGAWPLSRIIEAILFASQKPVGVKELLAILRGAAEANKENPQVAQFAKVKEARLREAIEVLEQKALSDDQAYEVRESVSGWQLVTKPHYAPWLRQIFPENRPARISAPAMETLAIIAYRQPITRADIEAVRGVAVDGVMQTLLDRGLLKIAGRAEIPGRPLLYETTQFFMEHFGLKHLDDLPNAGELRRIALPTAPIPDAEPTQVAAPEIPAADAPTTDAPAEVVETTPDETTEAPLFPDAEVPAPVPEVEGPSESAPIAETTETPLNPEETSPEANANLAEAPEPETDSDALKS